MRVASRARNRPVFVSYKALEMNKGCLENANVRWLTTKIKR
jgi:hypothetical protein